MSDAIPHTTGLPSLDAVLGGIQAGDNIVWRVSVIEEYQAQVQPYIRAAVRDQRRLVYFRFARHAPLIPSAIASETHELDPAEGFEVFIHRIHDVIGKAGLEAYYVFDCLSDLAVDWYSDSMLGNFFSLTCPYLFELKTIAYFGLLRHGHSAQATDPIMETTQLFLDVYHNENGQYIRPLKVQFREPPSLFKLYAWQKNDVFQPVSSSAAIAAILNREHMMRYHKPQGPTWDRVFFRAEERLSAPRESEYDQNREYDLKHQLIRMIVSRDESIMPLIEQHLSLEDLIEIRRHMIGSGLVGGKTVGMLIARNILLQLNPAIKERLESHDSFYVGSDVFYTYLVRNGVWHLRQGQRDPEQFLKNTEAAQRQLLNGHFPEYILRQFEEMLDYFGPYPIIVRSSSLLEDNYGNAFAGKYESVFCANQGTRETRLAQLLSAVRTVYASCMNREALCYRERYGLLDRDEQMALLIMRVSGSQHGDCFYPHLAGVGFSFNPYSWNRDIDPHAGVIRLVFGLGTRAVDRVDDDYTRVVALNAPSKRPEENFGKISRYSQRKMDYIDLDENLLVSGNALDVLKKSPEVPANMLTTTDWSVAADRPAGSALPQALTFDPFLNQTGFVRDMQSILKTLENAYHYPVDIEFTVNLVENQDYRINLLQCRPLHVRGTHQISVPAVDLSNADPLITARGAVVGQSRVITIDRLVYIYPRTYSALPDPARYEAARVIGDINKASAGKTIMMIAPGRWGTSTASLGVPVTFSDINHVAVLVEIEMMHEGLVPDVSLGTHFFNELVEMDMLYLALFPKREGNKIHSDFFESRPNLLTEILPDAGKWIPIISVIDAPVHADGQSAIKLSADSINQTATCFLEKP
jgi:hypothetical protein